MHYNDFVVTSTGYVAPIQEEVKGIDYMMRFNQQDLEFDKQCEPMQCTGLKDKKENLLFEQDIVKGDGGEIGIIKWDKPTARFIIYFYKDDYIIDFDDYRAVGIEKIGNVYENPELLKGGKE